MAKSKATIVNKSEAIRTTLSQYPQKGPAEIARMLSKQLGVSVSAKHVSSIKAMTRKTPAVKPQAAPAAARQTVRPPEKGKSSRRVAEIVTTLQSFIQQVGKDDLHQLIDAL